jgi:glycosyl transferase family 25
VKSFVITIKDNPKSVKSAERCIESGKKVGCVIRMFDAVTPNDDPELLFLREDLPIDGMREQYSRFENCASAFFSHYSLWKKCIQLKEPITIFEHDAVVKDSIPKVNFKYVMNIGHPSYGKYRTPATLGVNPLTSKRYMPGAHAYMITPEGANLLINHARRNARPTDVFMHMDNMPWLQEYYPWPVVADDSFTTIQRELGTTAKHNKVEIIDAV